MSSENNSESSEQTLEEDRRLYVPQHDGWTGHVKPNSLKEYCYYKSPGDEHFHLLVSGEIYLVKGDEKCCLNCALRHGIVTEDRMYWQSGSSKNSFYTKE